MVNPTGLITQTDRVFLCSKYRNKPILTIENHQIDRHIAAVGECLFMAPMCRSELCVEHIWLKSAKPYLIGLQA
jgi:hypothetical protein